jgi:hypothetical protein
VDFPLRVFAVFLPLMWLAAQAGAYLRIRKRDLDEGVREDLNVILAAALTLVGLIIGFTFSMAVTRYDQRKNYEEAEANAIGTEYVRADLLPAVDGARVHELLKNYLQQRVLFYTARGAKQADEFNKPIEKAQADLWSSVRTPALDNANPLMALVVSGMNDVLNSQGYTQAAWWNRIPIEAWFLMGMIAVCCNVLLGFTARPGRGKAKRLVILPLLVSISFFLIADLDSPYGGLIHVSPQNLLSLADSIR